MITRQERLAASIAFHMPLYRCLKASQHYLRSALTTGPDRLLPTHSASSPAIRWVPEKCRAASADSSPKGEFLKATPFRTCRFLALQSKVKAIVADWLSKTYADNHDSRFT